MEFSTIVHATINLIIFGLFLYNDKLHKENLADVHKAYQEERKELLDRIMANNIHEFKAVNGQIPVKKSESGNFLVDRMERSLKKQFQEFE